MDSLYGPDPVQDAMSELIKVGADRVFELTLTGFDTDAKFDDGFLQDAMKNTKIFKLTSKKTGSVYGVAIKPDGITPNGVHVIQVMLGDTPLKEHNWRKLSLVRGERGQIMVRPGWI